MEVPQVKYEASLLQMLKGEPGFARVLHSGSEFDFNYMVTDLLGPSIEALHKFCERQFSLTTVCQLAI